MRIKKKPNKSYITIEITENYDRSCSFVIDQLVPKKATGNLAKLTTAINDKISGILEKAGASEVS